MGKKDKQLQTVEIKQPSFDLEKLMSQAITEKVPIDSLERLLAMRRELKAEHAKEQYDASMARFQAECPAIAKKKGAKNKSKEIMYKYAPLEDIVDQVKELIAKHGFSYTFRQTNDGTKVRVECIVSHSAGHSEASVMETGLATRTDIMSGPQVIASTVTFNKRYAFINAFGITTADEDNGAQIGNEIQPPIDYTTSIAQSATQAELQRVWALVPLAKKKELEALKDKRKMELKAEESGPAKMMLEGMKR